jgi:hypothetical protein
LSPFNGRTVVGGADNLLPWFVKVKGAREPRESPYVVKERRGEEHGKERRGRVERGESVRHGRRSESERQRQRRMGLRLRSNER